jgi:hypothetical protein
MEMEDNPYKSPAPSEQGHSGLDNCHASAPMNAVPKQHVAVILVCTFAGFGVGAVLDHGYLDLMLRGVCSISGALFGLGVAHILGIVERKTGRRLLSDPF